MFDVPYLNQHSSLMKQNYSRLKIDQVTKKKLDEQAMISFKYISWIEELLKSEHVQHIILEKDIDLVADGGNR